MLKEYIRRFYANPHMKYTFIGTTGFGIYAGPLGCTDHLNLGC